MAELHVISALVRKRAELAGEINEIERQRRRISAKIEHIDASLVMFDYEGNPNNIKPIRKQYGRLFKTGHLKRMVLDVLREAQDPLSNKQDARKVIQIMKWEKGDEILLADVLGRVKDVRKRLSGMQRWGG